MRCHRPPISQRPATADTADSDRLFIPWAAIRRAPDSCDWSVVHNDMPGKWRNLPYAGPVYVYTMRDRNSQSREPDDTLGIFRSDGTAKPAERVVTSYLGMRGSRPAGASPAPR